MALCTDEMRWSVLDNYPSPTKGNGPSTFLPEQNLITINDPRTTSAIDAEEAEIRRQEDLTSPEISLLLLTLNLEHYTAHSRVLLQLLFAGLRLSSSTLPELESAVAKGLLATALGMSASETTKEAATEDANNHAGKSDLLL
ncbi:MAG: hypothetical protein Q9199_001776 [Rusavskia elegans]